MAEHDNRSAMTGQFVSDEYAAKHPDVTIRETRPAAQAAVRPDLLAGIRRAVSSSDGEFEYDGSTFEIDAVDFSGDDDPHVIKVEAGADEATESGQRTIYFHLRIEAVEDIR